VTDSPTPAEQAPPAAVVLTAIEARVLGCLVEKAAATPDVYPLTLNAVHVACNQKTNRDPIMNAEPGEVGHALYTLEQKKLVRTERGARALRYEHTIDAALGLTARARAVIALLLLRGPQTQPELLMRSERLADFPDLESLGDTLQRLISRVPALIVNIGRLSGQREDRYMHLLCGPVTVEQFAAPRAESGGSDAHAGDLEARVAELERLVAQLQQRFDVGSAD
jgi:uncharacterized protein YceH (UPF0502 family)